MNGSAIRAIALFFDIKKTQAGRVASAGADYRYGHNGMEEEDRGDQVSAEIASTGEKAKPGEGNLLNTEYRLYDPRLAQWLTRDPVFQPWESPYSAMAGNPILFNDPLGLAANDPNKDANVAKPTEAGQHIDYEGGHFMSVENSKGELHWAVSTKEIVVTAEQTKEVVETKNLSVPNVFKDLGLDEKPKQQPNFPDWLKNVQKDLHKDKQLKQEDNTDDQDGVEPGSGHYIAGAEEFGERGGRLKVSTKPLKSTGKIKYYDGWDGNQYTITKLVFNKRLMKVIVRSSVIGGVVLDGLELIDGYIEDGYSFGENFKTELAGAIGANVGASGGAYLGGLVGFEVAGPIGALVLATSGVIVFSWLGEEAAEALAREFFKNNNEEQKK